jgi:cell division protein FtsB
MQQHGSPTTGRAGRGCRGRGRADGMHRGQLLAALSAEEAHAEARERVMRVLRLRLARSSQELQRAHARIAELEQRVAELEAENAALREENRELRRENVRLTGAKRMLERVREYAADGGAVRDGEGGVEGGEEARAGGGEEAARRAPRARAARPAAQRRRRGKRVSGEVFTSSF